MEFYNTGFVKVTFQLVNDKYGWSDLDNKENMDLEFALKLQVCVPFSFASA